MLLFFKNKTYFCYRLCCENVLLSSCHVQWTIINEGGGAVRNQFLVSVVWGGTLAVCPVPSEIMFSSVSLIQNLFSLHWCLSCQSLHGNSHRGTQVNCRDEMSSHPTNQLWPCVAVGWGDASVREGSRVENRGILTQGNGAAMGYALQSAEDHSSTPSCLLLPPPSFCTVSLIPNTHCVFLTSAPWYQPLQPPSLSSCPSTAADVFHFSARSGTSWGSHRLVNRPALRLWLKNTFVLLCQEMNISLGCWLVSAPCFSCVLGILIHPQIRSFAWHTNTNTLQPTPREPLSDIILFSRIQKPLASRKMSVLDVIKICATLRYISIMTFHKGCVIWASFPLRYNGRDPNEMRWVGGGNEEW